jgi:2-keto-4-pentenoate hydratase/2-oxohepta-3-ene-1,7-dioic acid hydratase in catechol pathway
VTLSKQMCAKPVSPKIWRYDDVAPHWDRLVLRSFVHQGANRRLYQEGPVTTMRAPEELIRLHSSSEALPLGTAMFCGTVAVHGAIEAGEAFEMELEDPVLERKLTHIYKMTKLPIED